MSLFLMPLIKCTVIAMVDEIVGTRSALKSEIEKFEAESNDGIRFFFELGRCVKLSTVPIRVSLLKDTYQAVSFKSLSVE